MTRKILHLDLDAFYCAVEEQRDPLLIGKPFAVGGRPEERGVISSCSYAARHLGIRSAMPMARAIKICPKLIIVPLRHKAYSESSKAVMDRLYDITPLVEQISIDEAFMDISDLMDTGKSIAQQLQSSINTELNLPCSIGVATNKLLAKTANDVGKKASQESVPPNRITVVPPGDEAKFLAQLPVRALWGIGPKTAQRLAQINIQKIGELASYPENKLEKLFGKSGLDISLRAKGIDDRPIITSHEPKSISQEVTFARDIRNYDQLRETLSSLSKRVGKRLRSAGYSGTTVKLKLRWSDFSTLTRQRTLDGPTDLDSHIYDTVLNLFNKIWQEGKYVRLLGVGISGLKPPARQLNLWDDAPLRDKNQNKQLQEVLENLRDCYGNKIIRRGSELRPKKNIIDGRRS